MVNYFLQRNFSKEHFDYFIFGHRHYPIDFELTPNSRYINLGDWINYFTYAVFDGKTIQLKNGNNKTIFISMLLYVCVANTCQR
jgi:UDP-2,3-diacylglucosamine hydrolase